MNITDIALAAKMAGGSGGGYTPSEGNEKVIDLNSDRYATAEGSLGLAIVYMILGGGCNQADTDYELIENLFSEVESAIDKGQTVKFKLSTQDYAMSCESMLVNVAYDKGALVQLSANGGMFYGGAFINFEICFMINGDVVVNSTATPITGA